jgi:spore germination cell wall hydrolase CwlJ-like protein
MRFMMAVNLQASKPSVKQIFYYFADLLNPVQWKTPACES